MPETKIDRYIIKKINKEEIAVDNPEYLKYFQNKYYELFLKQSGIPSFYWDIEFNNYKGQQNSPEFIKIKYYADHCHKDIFDHVSLYLWGNSGCQKTALACNIGKQALRKGLKVKFVQASTLIQMMLKTSGYSKDDDIENEIDVLKEQDLLILDDVGDLNKGIFFKNNPQLIITEWDNFLRYCLGNGIKIVFTSNNNLHVFGDLLGESLFELLDRNCNCIQLTESIKGFRKMKVSDVFKNMN